MELFVCLVEAEECFEDIVVHLARPSVVSGVTRMNYEIQPKGGDIGMPTLQHLIDELRKLQVKPDEIRIKGKLYDELIEDADDICEHED